MNTADDTPLSDEELEDLADAINGFDVRLTLMMAERRTQLAVAPRPAVEREERDGCVILRPTFPSH